MTPRRRRRNRVTHREGHREDGNAHRAAADRLLNSPSGKAPHPPRRRRCRLDVVSDDLRVAPDRRQGYEVVLIAPARASRPSFAGKRRGINALIAWRWISTPSVTFESSPSSIRGEQSAGVPAESLVDNHRGLRRRWDPLANPCDDVHRENRLRSPCQFPLSACAAGACSA